MLLLEKFLVNGTKKCYTEKVAGDRGKIQNSVR